MLPAPTPRLRFRPMSAADLDAMAGLLGDPSVMEFYPAPKTRDEAAAWIGWNERNYAEYGFGLWILETVDGLFVGDCGLTWQKVNGVPMLEVGYHVRSEFQGRGYATEAAAACRDAARAAALAGELASDVLVAIIHPLNVASRRVAEKIGMVQWDDDTGGALPVRTVMGMTLV
ncbi:GNAT family N-acetyltransferase [Frondihabitans sp. Leaf304]|uniref:GNAT family N-acetyltransferase n=1 Tax=Frondihabitans sp. Leaf304 TaxID=1736329 RepID=UPI0007010A8B|nr:GNAT family N-acetyltransferase [Frondihabitans sp. Leaf304]KQQ28469.1 acetyltransferase [Frondihabitans sp. Leaf304]